jgi:CARDB
MQRLSLFLIAGAMVAVAAPASAAQQRSYAAPVIACHQGLTSDQRYLEVRATMQAVRGAVRMGVRFDLRERTPATAGLFGPRPAPDLGVWLKSKRGVNPYTYDQTVKGLDAPASYKMRVGFRWYGRHGRVLKTAHRLTPVCAQPDLRPNLIIKSVFVSLDRRHYTVVVRNNGATAAGPFNVGYTPAGAPAQTQPIAGLAPATQTRVTFAGSPCDPAAPPAFAADASNQVDESNETDNGARATC